MRSFFITFVLLMIISGCTKSATENKDKTSISASNSSSSAMSSGASDGQSYSRRLDEIALEEYLKRAIKSAGSSTIASAAFNSVCPLMANPAQNSNKCLYYRDKDAVYQFCYPEKAKKFIFSVDKGRGPSGGIKEQFKAASGRLIWKSGENLFVWDGTKTYSVADTNYDVTSFLISPNGQCIAWNTNWRTDYPGEDEEHFSDSVNKENIVFVSRIGSQEQKEVYWEAYRVDNVGADNREEKKLLAWSKVNPSILYLTTRFERQLYDGYQGIKAVNFRASEGKNLGEIIEDVLAFSNDEKRVAYTPNDETCCSGSNYTNNTLIVVNAESDKSVTVYDEWKEFGNQGKEEEYLPFKAAFSPDGSLIAISIGGSKRLATIRKTDGSGNFVTLTDRFAIGWLDQDTLVLAKSAMIDYRQRDKVQDVYIYNLKSGKEESLSLNDVTYLAFE